MPHLPAYTLNVYTEHEVDMIAGVGSHMFPLTVRCTWTAQRISWITLHSFRFQNGAPFSVPVWTSRLPSEIRAYPLLLPWAQGLEGSMRNSDRPKSRLPRLSQTLGLQCYHPLWRLIRQILSTSPLLDFQRGHGHFPAVPCHEPCCFSSPSAAVSPVRP